MLRSLCPRRTRPTFAALGTAIALAVAPSTAWSQDAAIARAIPAPVTAPSEYRRAVERGWRSEDGSPGHSYWQQGASYELDATLDPASGDLDGSVRIRYANNAPVTLNSVWLHLIQNFHKEGTPRSVEAEITPGVSLSRVVVAGQELSEGPLSDGPAYRVDGTLMEVRLPGPVAEGDTLDVEIGFRFTIPRKGIDGRMGHTEDRRTYFVAYWFPKMAVLDDIRVWDAETFRGSGEFYDDFANYSVSLTVPEQWSVMATGELENAEEVYSALTLERLAAAATSDSVVTIAAQGERTAHTVTRETSTGSLTYRFTAENVRDFAWTASDVERWDATSAVVPDRDEDGEDDRVLIHSFWHEGGTTPWSEGWRFAKQAVEFHSRYTGLTYPWSHMTLVEGADIIGGGMEFPMMTLIGAYQGADDQSLFNTVSHEVAHMWVPMIVGTNEKRYAWMDEGSAMFLEVESRMELWPGVDHRRVEARPYLELASAGGEQVMMRHADWYEPGRGYTVASYYKPVALMVALREVLGSEVVEEAYRTFVSEWAFKHPTPWDLFATFERVADRDLDWFWTSFFYETWTVDQAVDRVTTRAGQGATVVIEDRGLAPFPAHVRIRTSGGTFEHDIPVEHWLAGNRSYEIPVEAGSGPVTRVEIDPAGYAPDVDRSNNIWPRG